MPSKHAIGRPNIDRTPNLTSFYGRWPNPVYRGAEGFIGTQPEDYVGKHRPDVDENWPEGRFERRKFGWKNTRNAIPFP